MSNLSNEELDALLELAKAATPGAWTAVIDASFAAVAVGDRVVCGDMYNHRDASFIAAASPATITALVQQLQEAQRDAERLDWLERNFKTATVYMNGQHPWRPNHKCMNLSGPTLRHSIDAEIAKESQP